MELQLPLSQVVKLHLQWQEYNPSVTCVILVTSYRHKSQWRQRQIIDKLAPEWGNACQTTSGSRTAGGTTVTNL